MARGWRTEWAAFKQQQAQESAIVYVPPCVPFTQDAVLNKDYFRSVAAAKYYQDLLDAKESSDLGRFS